MSKRTGRLRELVQAFLGRDRGESREDVPASSSLSEDVQEVVGWRVRMQSGGLLSRLLGTRGLDRATAVGETVHMMVPIPRMARLRAEQWRVHVGDTVALDRPLAPHDDGIVMYRPEAAGVFEVRGELLDAQGIPIGDPESVPPLLQVFDARPVHAVDVALVRTQPSAAADLARLCDRGGAVVYFDLAETDRTVELRADFERLGAPRAAILVHSSDTAEVRTLGVDFRAVFLTATLRRLHGAGVPVVGVLSTQSAAELAAERTGIPCRPRASAVLAGLSDDVASLHGATWPRDPAGRLDRTTRTRAIDGNACCIELDNRRGRQQLFAAIDGARETVHLQYYQVRDGPFGDQLAARLVRAARRGARVRMMVDALYSIDRVAGATNAVARGLTAEPGIEVVSATPITSRSDLDPRVLKQRDHRKVVVIDGTLAFVGGRNACDEYYTGFDEVAITDWTPHERIPWFDAHAEIRGPLVGEIGRAFLRRWIDAGGEPPPGGLEAIVTPPAVGATRARLVLHEGVDDAAALLAYEALMDGAQDHLWVVNDFPIVPSLQLALRRALHRGVTVRLLTGCALPRRADGSFFEGPMHREAFEYMTKKRLEGLMRAGAGVWEYVAPPHPGIVCRGGTVRPYVHAKIVSVDGRMISVGSANLDATASYWEREANVIIEDPTVVRAIEAQLLRSCDRGVRLDPRGKLWQREGLLRDLASQLWPEVLYS